MEFDFNSVMNGLSMENTEKLFEKNNVSSKDNNDDDFFKPSWGKDGTSQTLVRFLPSKNPEAYPHIVEYIMHDIKHNGNRFFSVCPTMFKGKDGKNLKCPICEYNSNNWSDYDDSTKSQRKRKISWYSNILVINDVNNPDNNGKVFKYRFSKEIFDVLKDSQKETGIKKKINPFDIRPDGQGANFIIDARYEYADYYSNGRRPKYTASRFESIGAVVDKDGNALSMEQLKEVVENTYDLSEYLEGAPEYEKIKHDWESFLNGDVKTIEDEADNITDETIKEVSSADEGDDVIPDDEIDDIFGDDD